MKKILDLSHGIHHNCPGYFPYQMTTVNYETIKPKDGYTSERIYLNSHTATHIDAPYHHYPEGLTIDQMPVEWFCGEALYVDLGDLPAHTAIEPEMLAAYDEKIMENDIILIRTGVGEQRGWNKTYCDFYPFLSVECGKYLMKKKVKGIAMDTMSVGGPKSGDGALELHELLLAQNIWLGEEFYFPADMAKHDRWYVVAVPLKLDGCGGAPVRAVAMEL